MIDSYLWPDSSVLKNLLNIKDQKELDEAEANFTAFRLKELALNPIKGEYNLEQPWLPIMLTLKMAKIFQRKNILEK